MSSSHLQRIAWGTALFIAASVAMGNPATAEGCLGYGYDIGRLYRGLEGRVPYFAAHPPVYYSYPVPRTYGHSPFAYPPHFRTPEMPAETAPVTITNPYFTPQQTAAESPERTVSSERTSSATEPLVIHNPYLEIAPVAFVADIAD